MHWYNFFRQLHLRPHHTPESGHPGQGPPPSGRSSRQWTRLLSHHRAAARDGNGHRDHSDGSVEPGTRLKRPSTALGLSSMADAEVDATQGQYDRYDRSDRNGMPLTPGLSPATSLSSVRRSRGFFGMHRLLRSGSSSRSLHEVAVDDAREAVHLTTASSHNLAVRQHESHDGKVVAGFEFQDAFTYSSLLLSLVYTRRFRSRHR